MFQSLKSVVALASVASAAAFYDGLLAERQTTTCATGVHMMIAGGCAVPCGADVPSLLSTLISNVSYAFPGSDQYYVPYGDQATQAQFATPRMIAAFNDYVKQCPQTPIVFIGYSLGGIVNMNTLCGGVSASYLPNVIASIAYGEETFVGGLSYDAGTCTNSAPKYARANAAASCAAFAPAIKSYCDSTDPNCCAGGTEAWTHYSYPTYYDVAALDFIKARYAALAQIFSTSSSSSTVRSTSTIISTGTTTVSTTVSTSASTTTAVSVSTTATTTATTAPVVPTTATTAPGVTTTTATTAPVVVTTIPTTIAGVSTIPTTVAGVPTVVVTPVTTITTQVSTIRSSSTTTITFSPYSNSTVTRPASGSAVVPVSASSGSATIPHYSIPAVTSVIPASVSSFSSIPDTGILVASSVYASYVGGSIVTSVPSATGAAATAGAVTRSAATAAGSASGSRASTATVPNYTGAASKQFVSGAMGLAAGVAAYVLA